MTWFRPPRVLHRPSSPSAGNTQRLKTIQSVRILPYQQDQRRRLLVGLAAPLFPALEGPGVNTQLEGEHLPRHLQSFARLAHELRIHRRKRDRRDHMSPQCETSLAVLTHRLHARHELVEEASLSALRDASSAWLLGFLGHCYFPPDLWRRERWCISSSIIALRRRFSLALRSVTSSLSYSVSSQICMSLSR